MIDFRVVFGVIIGITYAVIQKIKETTDKNPASMNPCGPLISPIMLLIYCPIMLLCILVLRWFPVGEAVFRGVSVLLQAGLYYTLLLVLHPLLRGVISGKGRAVLWVLPNVLYLVGNVDLKPRWVIPVNREWLISAVVVWFSGAALVLLWKIDEHIRFREDILQDAYDAPVKTQALLRQEERKLGISREYILLISPAVKTPLSVGIFDRSIRILLPEKDYSDEELSLIFRHELIHIRRQDSATKFFLAVCTALSWFNPFVWLAVRRSGEDFESGCDELVLVDADERTRRLYAAMLLDSAAETRGFTTCLSADAVALRERLKNVVTPRRRFAGSAVTFMLVFLLFITSGRFALAFEAHSAAEAIFHSFPADSFTYSDLYCMDEGWIEYYADGTWEELTDYLSGLQLYRLSMTFADYSDPELYAHLSTPDGAFTLSLHERTVVINPADDSGYVSYTYYHYDDIDWDYLMALLNTHKEIA